MRTVSISRKGLLFFCLILAGLHGPAATVRAQLDPVVAEAFARQTPGVRFQRIDATTEFVYGTTLSEGDSPLASAVGFVNQWSGMLGRDLGEFVPVMDAEGELAYGVIADRETGRYRLHALRLHQFYQGVPVFRAGVGALVRNEPGHPLVLVSASPREFAGTGFQIDATAKPEVTAAMRENVLALMNREAASGLTGRIRRAIQPLEISEGKLVIWAGIDDAPAPPVAAVSFIASRGSPATWPDHQKYLIVAAQATGEILLAETQIHFEDVTGTVEGRATNGIRAAECDPVSTRGLPYAEVQIVGGNTRNANAAGAFVIPHAGTGSVTVRSFLRGTYFVLQDQAAGGAVPQLDLVVNTPGPANFLHNPSGTEQFARANVNAYLESNVVRDYVLLYQPAFPTIATQTGFLINNNINNTCNAFYNGSSINFYRNGGGCNNTAFSDVVYHEYGHHLVNVTGNGQGQFGEGAGDCVGVLIQDEPILGAGFSGNCSAGIRTANNTLQAPCTAAIHTCGQVLSGAVWDTRNQLVITEPANYRHIGAQLFFGMLIARGQLLPGNQTITNAITLIYLQLDDNDSSIGNGTPHYNEIATGFGLHNLPAPPLDPLTFEFPEGRPALISPAGGPSFRVDVSGLSQTPQPGTGTLFVDRGSGFEQFPMTAIGTNQYRAVFPTSECGRTLRYYVRVQTTTGTQVFSPAGAPGSFYTVISGTSLANVFSDNGETNPGWTVAGNATDGQWERGVPVGGGLRGDPPTDADGSGQCWLTANRSGNSDVDGGSTILTSPLLNGGTANNEELYISYWRWYSNHTGSNPQADVFVVEISNNNGTSWTSLETVGPTGAEAQGGWYRKSFRVRDFVTPTNQLRVRFNASDLGGGSVVEAAVDGIELVRVNCGPITVVPTAHEVVVGRDVAGGLAQLLASDNQRLCAGCTTGPSGGEALVQVRCESTLPTASPQALKIRLESNADLALTTVRMELFDFSAGVWNQVDIAPTTIADSVREVTLTGNFLRFVEPGTAAVQARITFDALSRNIPRWRACIDQFAWIVD